MKIVGIYIQDSTTLEYNRVDLFDDEKISVTSSIQNINDISKTYTDYSNTYTVPATKQNNKIFKHWYDNSNDFPFSTLTKSNAYIEIDTIPFRKGKIQLESANVIDGQAQDYSITFIGILGNLKDTFAGKYLKDLTSTAYDFEYTPNEVLSRVVDNIASRDVMFPLISSKRRWNYGSITDSTNNINNETDPIRYNELFPAIRLRAVLDMIENQFGINFEGTAEEPSNFLSDARFTNAYLYLKNADEFKYRSEPSLITYDNQSGNASAVVFDFANDTFRFLTTGGFKYKAEIYIVPTVANIVYTLTLLKNDEVFISINATSIAGSQYYKFLDEYTNTNTADVYKFVISSESSMTFNSTLLLSSKLSFSYITETITKNTNQTITVDDLAINKYFPEIKIEDFFSGLLKMFNLTCYSNDGINYTVEQLESYYGGGSDIDITKYVLQDRKALNRVKTYKKINFEYEKSDSFINVAFESNSGIPYGTLRYVNDPPTEGEEYSIKLPFEDLNFTNLQDKLQVGYCLKTDNQAYIPKPIILYDYASGGTTPLTGTTFYTATALIGNGTAQTQYKAFGQETLANGDIWSLNFPPQQSTLTNEIVNNGLYQNYYSDYFNNIYNYKARLIKLTAILPTSVLTTLKLNDSIIIRDAKYLINSYTTDLTTGLVQFELLTDERVREFPEFVTIGTQVWTTRNLNVTTYRDGTLISESDWDYYQNNPANEDIYGKLYKGSIINDPRGLAPEGYHIPTDAEWTILTDYLGGTDVAGGKMKDTGTSLWQSPNTGATNSSGFTGLPGGFLQGFNGAFNSQLDRGYFWSSSELETDSTRLWYRYINYNTDDAVRANASKINGFSVRLIKD
jgi:uncharacterized protein (TIGR02145 family)